MTTYQALAAGTPVVTLPGDFMRGRFSLGLYRQMQMTECIAENVGDYIDVTRRLCMDNAFSNSMRDQIKVGQTSIFNNRVAVDRHAKFFDRVMFKM
jgi:protein O-GlcNAc transferase